MKIYLAFFSLAPPAMLLTLFLFEPFMYQVGIERALVSELGQLIRLICVVIIIAMMAFYGRYILTSGDSRLDSKKGLWIAILVLGNVFGVPLFWYLFMYHPSPHRVE